MSTVGAAWSLIAFALAFVGVALLIIADAGRVSGLDSQGVNILFFVPAFLVWGIAGYRFHQGTVAYRQLPDDYKTPRQRRRDEMREARRSSPRGA